MNLANLDRVIAVLEAFERSAHANRVRMDVYFRLPGEAERARDVFSLADVPEPLRSPDPAHCGTAFCFAGLCQMLGAGTEEEKRELASVFARHWLGLDDDQADDLFLGEWAADDEGFVDLSTITPPQMLAHLRALRAGGPTRPARATRPWEPTGSYPPVTWPR